MTTELNNKKPLLLGIVNITPDSFSDGGTYSPVEHGLLLAKQGARVLDLGAESTRPGAAEVAADVELKRLMPVLTELRKLLPDVPLSVDTRKAAVAEAALAAGAAWINDVSGGVFDPAVMQIAARYNAVYIVGHSRGTPADMLTDKYTEYPDGVIAHVLDFWHMQAEKALAGGIKAENIIVDPGFGFAKLRETNMEMAERFDELVANQPYRICAGVSRKRFLAPDLPPAARGGLSSRMEVELAHKGAAVIRTHDPAGFLKIYVPGGER